MKVYAIVCSMDYEGHFPPSSIFSTREAAEEEKKRLEVNIPSEEHVEIFEYDLDKSLI